MPGDEWVDCDDAELVAAANGGDKAAFGELVRRHEVVARRVALRMIGAPHLAEEVAQEAVVLAFLSLPRLRCPERFGPWLCGITLNLARRVSREHRRLVLLDSPDLLVGGHATDGHDAVEVAAVVQHAVSRLPVGQREATVLFYWLGLSHVEVAAELGISVAAVKNRLHHARSALAQPLASAFEEETTAMTAASPPSWITMSVTEVRRGEDSEPSFRPHVVLLREAGGERTLPVWIGPAEAHALAMVLESAETPRPITHQLAANLVSAAGAKLREARITRLVDNTFYAMLLLDAPGGVAEVDARPSDAVLLALTVDAPIKADADLLADVRAIDQTAWQEYRTGSAELVAELRRQHEEAMRRLARE